MLTPSKEKEQIEKLKQPLYFNFSLVRDEHVQFAITSCFFKNEKNNGLFILKKMQFIVGIGLVSADMKTKVYRYFIGSADLKNKIYRFISVSADMKKAYWSYA